MGEGLLQEQKDSKTAVLPIGYPSMEHGSPKGVPGMHTQVAGSLTSWRMSFLGNSGGSSLL